MFAKSTQWVREHPRVTATIGAAATAAAAYYGIPPEYSAPVLDTICDALALCPRV